MILTRTRTRVRSRPTATKSGERKLRLHAMATEEGTGREAGYLDRGSRPDPPTLGGTTKRSPAAAALEISDARDGDDDDGRWKDMDVRSSVESRGLILGTSGWTMLAVAAALFAAVIFTGLSLHPRSSYEHFDAHGNDKNDDGNDNDSPVAPLKGQAYLTLDEFRDVRTALPGESVLVTGGLGFIGSHVVDLLLHRGFDVTILDDESNGHNHNRYAKEMVPKDITVTGDLPAFPPEREDESRVGWDDREHRYTHVVHLAAAISVSESMNDPEKYERINYEGSKRVLEWIDGYNERVASGAFDDDDPPPPVKKLVAASSAAVYGDPDPKLLPLEESAPYGGLSPYADTKYRMEGLMREFVEKQNVDNARGASAAGGSPAGGPPASATALRFFNVYGPRQDPKNPYSGVISLFLEAALGGRDITVLGDGKMTRDFVYVKDVARAIVLALLREERGDEAKFDVYNVCTGKTITINTLAKQVKKSMGSNSKITHLAPREGDIRESSCNPAKARRGIGFASTVPQEGGLEKTASWFRLEEDDRRRRRKAKWRGQRTVKTAKK